MQKVKEKLNLVTYSLSLLFRRSPWLSTLFIILIALQGLLPTMSVMASIRLGNIISSPDHSGLMTVAVFWALTFVFPGRAGSHYQYSTKHTESACHLSDATNYYGGSLPH
ncbi:hypothetical protein [Dickeya dadantii]|uniref:hypothetical protein n=1 Tax=Dickeya dadantii TaxID=204038 RepID=UPI000ABCFAC9|nr:hypothetical protein [Dickeya dadantii]